jgi:16S rRNA (cytidine1402-2'-O)-methyltransferase
MAQLLSELEELAGPNREVVIARELSKLHEEYLRGTVQHLRGVLEQRAGIKGECVVLIASAT